MIVELFKQGCPVCQKNTPTTHHCYFEGHEYVRCETCDLIYQVGETDPEKMLACYTGGRIKRLRRQILNGLRKIENQSDFDLRMSRARSIFEYASSKASVDKGTYLDIGCNKGFNLYAAEERGWTAFGNELIEEITRPIKNSKPHLKKRIWTGSFTELAPKYQDNQFDLITCIDVIEHLTRPTYALEQILRILKPGGVVIFQTPEATPENIALKENWGGLKANEHLLLFNQENFKILAEKVGYKKFEVAPQPFEECDGNFVITCWP